MSSTQILLFSKVEAGSLYNPNPIAIIINSDPIKIVLTEYFQSKMSYGCMVRLRGITFGCHCTNLGYCCSKYSIKLQLVVLITCIGVRIWPYYCSTDDNVNGKIITLPIILPLVMILRKLNFHAQYCLKRWIFIHIFIATIFGECNGSNIKFQLLSDASGIFLK